ncbi:hypothetical protein ACIPPS_02320 [Streptomyces sp. NPDC090127]|uniref:hypothetical protein n=1 Tax=Streptomyces sp. NPDC090127 TaxID=3365953 RepID=UPI00381BD9AE
MTRPGRAAERLPDGARPGRAAERLGARLWQPSGWAPGCGGRWVYGEPPMG